MIFNESLRISAKRRQSNCTIRLELFTYFMHVGARCEANTFDGERCLYGSLTNNIKYMIKNYKQVTASTMRRDAYVESLRKY